MRSRLYLALMILIVFLLAVPASLVTAADPPEPTYVEELPVVDGEYSEWDLDFDFFSDLYKHFDREPPDFIMGHLYLQYDCGSNVLCALVLVDVAPYWDPPLWLDITNPAAQFLSLGTDVLVDGTDLNSGTLPNMACQTGMVTGRLYASRMPVMTADRSRMVFGFFISFS